MTAPLSFAQASPAVASLPLPQVIVQPTAAPGAPMTLQPMGAIGASTLLETATGVDVAPAVLADDPASHRPVFGKPSEVHDPVFRAKSKQGANTTTTGTAVDRSGAWQGHVAVNFNPDMNLQGVSRGGYYNAYIGVNNGDFTNIDVATTGSGPINGALHGLHSVTHTRSDGDGHSYTYTTMEPHQAMISGSGTADGWSAHLTVPFGFDSDISGHRTKDGFEVSVRRNGNYDLTVTGTGAATVEQQLTTAIALAEHH